MWIPKSTAEIITVVTSGSLEENSSFDVKRELPSNNIEIAKDIAAMTNDGGVIIYGIDEDESKRPTILHPIPLLGQRERINAIVRTGMAEPPEVSIKSFPTDENTSIGYVVVYIPPSERAPHMVTVKGHNRYYGRTATGNVPLNEGEIARLYIRRLECEVNRDELLSQEIESCRFELDPDLSYLHCFIRPVFPKDEFFGKIAKTNPEFKSMLDVNLTAVNKATLSRFHRPNLEEPVIWKIHPDGIGGASHPLHDARPQTIVSFLVNFNGVGHLFFGRVAQKVSTYNHAEQLLLFTPSVIGNTTTFIALMGELYHQIEYVSPVDVGLAITGLKGARIDLNGQNYKLDSFYPYERDDFRKTTRISALSLKNDAQSITRQLLSPLFDTMTQEKFDPFPPIQRS